jgi:hypothetical protein
MRGGHGVTGLRLGPRATAHVQAGARVLVIDDEQEIGRAVRLDWVDRAMALSGYLQRVKASMR